MQWFPSFNAPSSTAGATGRFYLLTAANRLLKRQFLLQDHVDAYNKVTIPTVHTRRFELVATCFVVTTQRANPAEQL